MVPLKRRAARIWRGGRLALLAFAVLALAPSHLPMISHAAANERIISEPNSQLALFGYDAVAYSADGEPRVGLAEHEVIYAGLVWRFANEGNRQAFVQEPARFVPAYGGHSALMVARGATADGHPEISLVLGGRVFLFHSIAARYAFLLEAERNLSLADANWPDLEQQLSP